MQNFNWQRTDLIDESEEVVVHQTKEQKEKLEQSSGIQIEDRNAGRVKITDVRVDAEGEKQIGQKGRAVYYPVCPNANIRRSRRLCTT